MPQSYPPPIPMADPHAQPRVESGPTAPPVPVQIHTGRYFRFALPAGWIVQENSNLICLNDPAGNAAIMSVGLVGMLQPMPPEQFVHYALAMHQMQPVRILAGQPISPPPGSTQAAQFELTYVCQGTVCRASVTCHVTIGYGQCNASLTLASAREPLWPQFAGWLPQVAQHVGPAGMQTYMAGQVAANNQRDAAEFGRRLQAANDHTFHVQEQINAGRAASQDRIHFHFRENLGNVATYQHPYENRTVELSATQSHYWINRQGEMRGTDDPSYDPNVGSIDDWIRMRRTGP